MATAIMFAGLSSAASAVEALTLLPPATYDLHFDATSLPDGWTYTLTINGTDYILISAPGPEKTITVAAGASVSYAYSTYSYEWRTFPNGQL